ncbi:hypothetical protein GF314_08040 [bacterium]|nr:hypothetical protein [bacterium]
MADRTRALLAVALVAVLAGPGSAATDDVTGRWILRTPLGDVGGLYRVLLEAGTGRYRLEVALQESDQSPTPETIAHRRGRGWTVCGGPDGSFVQAWSERWHQVGPRAGGFLAELAALPVAWSRRDADGGARAATRPLVLTDWRDLPEDWRPVDWRPTRGNRLRRHMVTRGLGRGGPGVKLRADLEGPLLTLTTARWPVTIEAGVARHLGDGPDWPAEAYLPLWPLAEFRP